MTKPLNRRAFLTTGAIATAAVAVVGARPAGAATGLPVYRLSADWGYPVGPKNKTRCACRACFRRAESSYFATREAAIAGRIHPCCVCQPYRTTIAGVSGDELFPEQQSADLRDPRVGAVFAAAATAAPAAGSIDQLLGVDPDGSSTDPTGITSFARTGTSLRLAGVGAGVLALGGALIAFRNRRPPPDPIPIPVRQPKEPS